jgi:hypothetical protein
LNRLPEPITTPARVAVSINNYRLKPVEFVSD